MSKSSREDLAERHVVSQAGAQQPEPPPPPAPRPQGVNWVPDRAVPWQGVRRTEVPVYPEPPEPLPDRVQLYATGQIISDRRRQSLLKYPDTGDLAVLPGGRLRSRRRVIMNDGSHVYAYADFDPLRNIELPLPPAVDWLAILEGRVLEAGGPNNFHFLEKAPLTERARLVAELPQLCAEFGIEVEPEPVTLFSPGVTRYRKTLMVNVDVCLEPEFWRQLALRHSQGHWALDGEYSQVGPLSESSVWCPEELSVAEANVLAIKSGSGAIRSRHDALPDWAKVKLKEQYVFRYASPIIEILTVLGRAGGNRTLIFVAPLEA